LPAQPPWLIIGRTGKAACLRGRLSSNVRRRNPRKCAYSVVLNSAQGALMSKPFVSLGEVQFDDVEENGLYTSKRALFSQSIGARKLGYNLTELPPGKAQCPFHSHREEEEMFVILEGEGELRFGEQRFKIRRHDVIACPTGGPEVAHQIINTGKSPLRYLSVSSLSTTEICEYPDSGKIGVFASTSPASGLRKLFREESAVEYYDRESTEPPNGDA